MIHFYADTFPVKLQTNKFDCSDARVVYWWMTGANRGGAKKSTQEDFRNILLKNRYNKKRSNTP